MVAECGKGAFLQILSCVRLLARCGVRGGGVGRRLTPPPLPFSEAPPHVPVLLGPSFTLRLFGDVNGVMHRAVLGGRLATQAHGT